MKSAKRHFPKNASVNRDLRFSVFTERQEVTNERDDVGGADVRFAQAFVSRPLSHAMDFPLHGDRGRNWRGIPWVEGGVRPLEHRNDIDTDCYRFDSDDVSAAGEGEL